MKSRVLFSLALLGAFVLGLLCVRPAAQALQSLALTTCKNKTICAGNVNSAVAPTAVGFFGNSKKGIGIAGVVGPLATPAAGGPSGIGVAGTGPNFGVAGEAPTTGAGVIGISGTPPSGSSSVGVGVAGSGATGVAGGGLIGVAGAGSATGVAGVSALYGGAFQSTSTSPGTATLPIAALVAQSTAGASIFSGEGSLITGTSIPSGILIDPQANIHTSGKLFTTGSCNVGCIAQRVVSYGTSAATPTLEDTGEAQLRAGAAYVRLDRAFANAIDPHLGYVVLITPEAATTGLYVTGRTMDGFQVHENPGGHSFGAFAYRIVAHPYGSREPRLPFEQMPRPARISVPHV